MSDGSQCLECGQWSYWCECQFEVETFDHGDLCIVCEDSGTDYEGCGCGWLIETVIERVPPYQYEYLRKFITCWEDEAKEPPASKLGDVPEFKFQRGPRVCCQWEED